jgi:uncharacterized membrane protein (UPF0136 family)
MKPTAYSTFLYGLIVVLSGVMAYSHNGKIIYLTLEALLGTLILISSLFMIQNKKWSYIFALVLVCILTSFYGYFFAKENYFFPGLLSAVSVLLIAALLIKIFKISEPER